MDLLGPSLAELLTFQFERFSIKTTCMLAIKMITAVELLHAKGILHRLFLYSLCSVDFCVHYSTLYIIDFFSHLISSHFT
jgi:hypothetical protein